MNKSILAITIASLVSPFSNLHAEQTSSEETMVVTANRFEQSTLSTTAQVEVVTKEQIEAIQANDLFEVFRRLPGVQVASNGGYGQQQSLFVRGTNSDHVLVLIDGVKTSSATGGGATISALPLIAVQRIEFIRGPRAAMYGSDAVGGVINIITDTTKEEKKLSLGAGSDELREASVSLSGSLSDKLSGSFSSRYAESEGYSAKNTVGDEDNDGFDTLEFALNLKYQFNDAWAIKFNSTYADSFVEYDSGDATKDQQLYTIVGGVEFNGIKHKSQLTLSQALDSNDNHLYSSVYETEHQAVAFNYHFLASKELTLMAGLEWLNDDVSNSTNSYDETSRSNKSLYAGGFYDNQSVQLELALRGDDNERYGSNTTWQAGVGWWFVEDLRFVANAGTAFKAPTFNDLYWPGAGNPNLKPEESLNYEGGIEGYHELFSWSAIAYHNQIENMILGWPAENVGEAEIKGIELSAQFDTGLFNHNVSFDLLDPVDKDTDQQLARRAKESAKWNITYAYEQWRADLSYLYQGDRYESNGEKLDAYSLVDLAASYFVTEQFVVRGRIANLLDEEYTLASGYNTQERSYFVNLDYSF